jgi:hypothetical protein
MEIDKIDNKLLFSVVVNDINIKLLQETSDKFSLVESCDL